FSEELVFLRRQWEQEIVPVPRPPLRHLKLFRPATLDLIVTKMMRGGDETDLADIEFMIRHDRVTPAQIEGAIADAVIPDVPELCELFERAKLRVRSLAQKISNN